MSGLILLCWKENLQIFSFSTTYKISESKVKMLGRQLLYVLHVPQSRPRLIECHLFGQLESASATLNIRITGLRPHL